MREMTDPDGGFYSAEDADSVPPEAPRRRAQEGRRVLPVARRRTGRAARRRRRNRQAALRDRPDGNAPDDPHQEFTGKNLLYVARSIDDIAEADRPIDEQVVEALNDARVKLFQARLPRPRPHRDDKILTAWNGLMIGALARMARLLRGVAAADPAAAEHYLDAARRAAAFIRERMWNAGTRTLLRRYRDGAAEIEAYAEDYAYLIFGLIELFQADPAPMWLEWAIALQHQQDELFWDEPAAAGSAPPAATRVSSCA